ncbi:hypothetical protein T492DRAFT_286886 [Pavlovales sp. CCMP2436]|nr:hypothetical protein T492DRAFT_286886 [Pavlovales sp. CCMP2436]
MGGGGREREPLRIIKGEYTVVAYDRRLTACLSSSGRFRRKASSAHELGPARAAGNEGGDESRCVQQRAHRVRSAYSLRASRGSSRGTCTARSLRRIAEKEARRSSGRGAVQSSCLHATAEPTPFGTALNAAYFRARVSASASTTEPAPPRTTAPIPATPIPQPKSSTALPPTSCWAAGSCPSQRHSATTEGQTRLQYQVRACSAPTPRSASA